MKKQKLLISILIISAPLIILTVFGLIGKGNRKHFYDSKINSKIIDSSNWQKRTTEYFIINDLQINITPLDTVNLRVGDSIVKESKSWKYKIYRINKNKKYQFYRNYQMEE